MKRVSRLRGRLLTALLLASVLTGSAVAQERERPRSYPGERSVFQRIVLWVLDTLSSPPG